MKRFAALLLALVLIFTLTACQTAEESSVINSQAVEDEELNNTPEITELEIVEPEAAERSNIL